MTGPGRPVPVVGLMLATVANLDTGEVEPARVTDAARRAEAAGFDGVYVGDHLLHPHPLLESVVTLSVVAASTERIALGPCVMLLGLRDPRFMARQLGTLAAFAPGRLRVGVGLGGEKFATGMLLPMHVDASGRGRDRAAVAWARLTDVREEFPRRLFVAGRHQEIVEQLHQYWELGCTEFVLGPAEQGDRYLEQVDLLAEQVLPAMKTFS